MVENRNQSFVFTIKEDVYNHAVALATEKNIGNVKVFMTKEIMKYAKRMSKDRMHAKEPIPRKLKSSTSENRTITLMLTEEEMQKTKSLMKYHWYYIPETEDKHEKYQNSQFMACLIEHTWLKLHPEQTIAPKVEEKPVVRRRINLDIDHDGEDWSGEG